MVFVKETCGGTNNSAFIHSQILVAEYEIAPVLEFEFSRGVNAIFNNYKSFCPHYDIFQLLNTMQHLALTFNIFQYLESVLSN